MEKEKKDNENIEIKSDDDKEEENMAEVTF